MRDLRTDISDKLLARVHNPGQFVGMEINARCGDVAAAEVAVVGSQLTPAGQAPIKCTYLKRNIKHLSDAYRANGSMKTALPQRRRNNH